MSRRGWRSRAPTVAVGAIAKWIPKAFDLMYRDYGPFTIEQVAPQHLHVVSSAMPTELSSHENWQRSVPSGLHALFFLTGVQGTTELTRPGGLQRRMQFDLRWTS